MTQRLMHTQKQAAERLGLSNHTFVRLVRPEIKRVPIDGTVRYPDTELQRWINNHMEDL